MASPKKIKINIEPSADQIDARVPVDISEEDLLEGIPSYADRRRDIDTRPHRPPLLHWAAFVLSVISLALLAIWMAEPMESVPPVWLWLDIGLGVFFAVEFLTRSGFRWDPPGYLRSRVFDFVAIIPALVLVHFGVILEGLWIWLILIARVIRLADRLLGDGFVQRNFFALLEGFEEEITDRVLLRIMARIQVDLYRGKFGHGVADALDRHKPSVLRRIREEHPSQGVGAGLARIVGLEKALERAEERTYDAVVDVLKSPEMDNAIREAVDSTFSVMRDEIKVKSWRQKLGVRR